MSESNSKWSSVRQRGHCAQATYEFSAEVSVLTHSTTIQPRYQAVIHCEIVRQVSALLVLLR